MTSTAGVVARGAAVAFSLPIGLAAGGAAACALAVANEATYALHIAQSRIRAHRRTRRTPQER